MESSVLDGILKILWCQARELGRGDNNSTESLIEPALGCGSQGRNELAERANIFSGWATEIFVKAAEIALKRPRFRGLGGEGKAAEKVQVRKRGGYVGQIKYRTVVMVYGGGPLKMSISWKDGRRS